MEVVPDKPAYIPGDIARIRIVSPFPNAEALMIIDRSGIIERRRFILDGLSTVVSLEIQEAWTPNVWIRVELTGKRAIDEEHGATLPASADGSTMLSIPPASRRLSVTVRPRDSIVTPGGSTVVDAEVRDWKGSPVAGAEFAVVVVDEAVLALSPYATPDPLLAFYPRRQQSTYATDIRERLYVPGLMPEGIEGGVAGGVVGGVAGGVQELRPREDFRPLALFAARCVTDESGALHVPVLLPDTITRYRIMVVGATKGNQFGSGGVVADRGTRAGSPSLSATIPECRRPRRTVVQRTESR